MASTPSHDDLLASLQSSFLTIQKLKARLAATEEPIAVIGMGCRLPGQVVDPNGFWQLLLDGVDAVTEVPPSRWNMDDFYDPTPDTPGKSYTRQAAFLTAVECFDLQFFGISPREAVSMDPQQRILLEVAWEAIERAGQVWDRLQGEATGVFIGISGNDYAELMKQEASEDTTLAAYSITGNALNAAAGRISYLLGLHGPSMAVDTACSSSLVAVHLACQSLRIRECRMALAGGVNLILNPHAFVALSQIHALAPDGRCKTFAATADGYGRGEGCGIVVLKRLSDALSDGDQILATIRGSAVNQDGASSGLTVPNGLAQQALIRQALANAKVAPNDVAYVETHGTGTPLGDPIEVEALGAVFGHRQTPLVIGTAKRNVGHLEAAAGITGLIKTILMLQHGYIPPHMEFTQPNPHIAWETLSLHVSATGMPWPTTKRIAGVSSFGFTGTNAHVVVEAAPDPAPPLAAPQVERPRHILTISAKSASALTELAARYAAHLERTPESLADSAFSANTGRRHFRHRLAVVAASATEASAKLAAYRADQRTPGVFSGEQPRGQPPGVAFVFTGQGAQYVQMGRLIYTTQPTFRAIINRCDEILRSQLDRSLIALLYPEEGSPPSTLLSETAYTQPALFALEYALAELWRSWGIEPTVVLGHSLGEYVAACVAGVFSLEDGLRLVAERARLMQALPRDGRMVAVFAAPVRVEPLLQPYAHDVVIAAINGPEHTVISGRIAAVTAVEAALAAAGIEAQPLTVSHAFHSPLIEPMLAQLAQVVGRIKLQPPRIPLVSNLTGAMWATGYTPDAAYWCKHAREPVHFMAGVQTLVQQGHLVLEIGPKPVLAGLIRQTASDAVCLPSLMQGRDDWETMLTSLATLYTHGVEFDGKGFDRDEQRRRIPLPTYPFQQKRYWIHERDMLMSSQTPPAAVLVPGDAQNTSALAPQSLPRPARQQQLQQELVALMASAFQLPPHEIGLDVPFLELGADSIVLANAVRDVGQTYGVKLTIRQFFEDLTNIATLADYLDDQLPPPEPPPPAPPPPWGRGAEPLPNERLHHFPSPSLGEESWGGEGSSTIERIMRDQLAAMSQLMTQQLHVLGGATQMSPSTIPAPPPQPSPVGGGSHDTPPPAGGGSHDTPPPSGGRPGGGNHTPLPDTFATWKKPQTQSAQLTPRQQEHRDALVARYNQRTRRSKELTQTYRSVLADNRASAGFRPSIKEMLYPLMGERAEGAYFWDVDGNRYLDITMGFGVLLFGHAPPFVTEAVAAQLQKGLGIGPTTQMAGEVAQLVCELTGMERVTFCNTGTEAVMTALRIARTKTKRTKIAYFTGSYHGHAEITLGMAESGNEQPQAVSVFPGVPDSALAEALILEYGNPQSLDVIRAHAHELAAVLVEPVQSRHPDLQPAAFLRQLRTLTRETGITLIFDETITGFRIHPGGAQAWFGVDADIATYGKIPGGGLPIGLVAGRAPWMDCIDGGFWNYGDSSHPTAETTFFAGTFMKHPLTMAAARAILQRLKADGPALHDALNQRTTRLVNTLNAWFAAEAVPIHMVHFGSLFRFVFTSNLDLFFYHLLDKGVFIWEGRNCFLSVAHTDDDVDDLIRAIQESIAELRAGGILPEAPPQAVQSPSPLVGEGLGREASAPTILHTLPLNEAQQQLWVLAQLSNAGAVAYHDCVCFELNGHLQPAWLRQSLQQIVDRHEALRTTIDPGGQVQQVWANWRVELPVIDLAHLAEAERRPAMHAWLKETTHSPLNLATGPVLDSHLVRLAPAQHVLVLRAHHAFSDGWSWSLIVQELGQFYNALDTGIPIRPAPPMQFRDYLIWQAQQKNSPAMAEHEAYWLDQLAGPLPVLDLPTDRPRPTTTSFGGSRVTWQIPRELADQLRQLARTQGCTLFMTLFAGFAAFLHRIADQADIVIGIPVGGRFPEGSSGLVGYCTHLLPIRSQLDAHGTCVSYLQQMRRLLLNGLEHQEYPFARLYEKLNAAQGTQRSPVITVTFNLDQPLLLPTLGALDAALLAMPQETAAFDLALNVIEVNGDLACYCDYSTELFDAATIDHLLHAFQIVMAAIVANPHEVVTQLPLLSPTEQQQQLVEWNATQADYPQQCIHHLFEAQVEATPDHVALIYGEQRITFRELNATANRLAHDLIARGVGSTSPVGVMAERSPMMVASLLAILKAGAAYLPLDPTTPAARLAYILTNSGAKQLMTQRDLRERVPADVAITIIQIDTMAQAADLGTSDNPAVPVTPDHLAYILYTSGSTGQPKGVEAHHRGAINRFNWMWRTFPFAPGDVCCQKTALSFGDSIWEVFGPLLRGVPSVLLSDQVIKEPARLVELLARHAVSRLVLVPSLLRTLLDTIPDLQQRLPALRLWVCSGEVLPAALCERFHTQLPQAMLLNLYGSSEVAADVTWYDTRSANAHVDGINGVPIGRPIDNTQTYILDRHKQPVPIGVPGDLYVGGVGVARGYRDQPQLTAERFVPNPFANSERDERLYMMGDRARYRADGTIEYLGRKDFQVKVRGFRIELGEVEAALNAHPAVRQALVLARTEAMGDNQLIAYLTPQDERSNPADFDIAAIRRFVAQKLPAYMLPAVYVPLTAFPLTAGGKVDRLALPPPEAAIRTQKAAYVAPRTATESALVAIWSDVLELHAEQIGIHDNFFEVGGHSLRAVQVMNRIQEQLLVTLSLDTLFAQRTIADLAELVELDLLAQTGDEELLKLLDEIDEMPTSLRQEGI